VATRRALLLASIIGVATALIALAYTVVTLRHRRRSQL